MGLCADLKLTSDWVARSLVRLTSTMQKQPTDQDRNSAQQRRRTHHEAQVIEHKSIDPKPPTPAATAVMTRAKRFRDAVWLFIEIRPRALLNSDFPSATALGRMRVRLVNTQ